MELIAELVGGGTYVDVGANLGSIALPVARSGGRVIAIEANRGLAGLLATNALNNGLYNVEVHHAAVGETRRLAKFPMVPLSAVMVGAQAVLRNVRLAWIVESGNDTPENRAVMEVFRAAGYQLWWFLAPFVTRRTSRSGDPSMLTRGDFNIVAMPDGREPPWEMPLVAGPPPGSGRPGELSLSLPFRVLGRSTGQNLSLAIAPQRQIAFAAAVGPASVFPGLDVEEVGHRGIVGRRLV
ncbi:MAG: FkbM family methyltransferase [Phenylobacterium sp.]|nr:FkbM family methyltransferase [Phenylobacterium sp.]MBP8245693.1 FkbM family methyltransferase [Phenylobacterium sp.]